LAEEDGEGEDEGEEEEVLSGDEQDDDETEEGGLQASVRSTRAGCDRAHRTHVRV
jgi:hypothetical protein